MFRIGEFSKLAKTTVKALRFYDEIGLFAPELVDGNGYRYYSIESLPKLQTILELKNGGVSLDRIKRILRGENVIGVLTECASELEETLAQNSRRLLLINQLMTSVKKGAFMKEYQAKKITLPACTVYYRDGVIPTYSELSGFVLETGEEVKAHNPTLECTGYCFVTYEAREYQERDVRLRYSEAVTARGKESENIRFADLPEQAAISVMHRGPYEKLGEAYAYAVNWIKQNGLEMKGKIRECYINGCWDTEDPEDYLTEIQIPV